MELLNSLTLTFSSISHNLIVIISGISDIKRFNSPSKLVRFVGLDSVVKQSRDFKVSSMKISKRDSSYLRYAINKVAFLLYTIVKLSATTIFKTCSR